ncbi:hypothetical protein LTR62_001502 [Meristemomyces frigidus]|uniref:Uncharacterized protein n=1 Tax=Meristemomyces frigidus TaxID=1508187 RepID=A0AAN7TLK7_9PEZI|nr:hypothetical protein LTR62_001502 [Meristemomyces frigidus]
MALAYLSSFIWDPPPPPLPRVTDASHHPLLRAAFLRFLDHTEPPQVFKASEVAQSLSQKQIASMGYEDWRGLIPAIREMAWELRELGYCDILFRGKVLSMDVELIDVEGAVRFRRKTEAVEDGLTF